MSRYRRFSSPLPSGFVITAQIGKAHAVLDVVVQANRHRVQVRCIPGITEFFYPPQPETQWPMPSCVACTPRDDPARLSGLCLDHDRLICCARSAHRFPKDFSGMNSAISRRVRSTRYRNTPESRACRCITAELPASLVANCFHDALECLQALAERFFGVPLSVVFVRFQELFLCAGIMRLVEQYESRLNDFGVNQFRIYSDDLPFVN